MSQQLFVFRMVSCQHEEVAQRLQQRTDILKSGRGRIIDS